MPITATVASVFADGGALSAAVAGFEPREGQRKMAAAVADVIEDGGTLLAEAGTGTGKTLAYLIPAILSGQRVLVSTGTKNLQEQIFFKDLPALRDALGIPFTATLMKGRSNYLCLHRFEIYKDGVEGDTSAMGRLIETGDRVLLPVISEWAAQTTTGDRAELRELPEDVAIWKDIAADADTCLGTDCPRYGDCFVTLMRQRAAESDVVIVNHHLLCADASVRLSAYGEVVPSCPTLVVDEAHQLEEVATQYFGFGFSNYRVDDLVRDTARLLSTGTLGNATHDVHGGLEQIAERSRAFFSSLSQARLFKAPGAEARGRYTAEALEEQFESGLMLVAAFERLEAALTIASRAQSAGAESAGRFPLRQGYGGQVASRPTSGPEPAPSAERAVTDADKGDAVDTILRRTGEARHDLRRLMRADDPDFVYFVESRGRGLFLRAAPIDVSRIISDALFDRFRSVVLTSATLAVDGEFDYVKGRLGIRECAELRVESEFDFTRQALLYLPRKMPPPNSPTFAEAVAREAIELLRRSRGRAFVLFTSYAVLRTVQQFLEMSLEYPILVQGSAPRSVLIDEFRRTPNAVLLATSSFWQGVDVVGDALSCVIIDKLPFASPGDPVTAARIDALRARGGDPFSEYQVPLAILALQQGLGRLIRHRTDRGVLAVLDPRLKTMGYGRRFLASLPPAPVTHDLAAVGSFFV
jgi:ATP-dependent DNA helicase DinG